MGGDKPVPEGIANELKALGLKTERLGGKNRYQTSVLVDARVREISRVYDQAVIANAFTVFDALSMGTAAGKLGVGILLNDGKSITAIESALTDVDSVMLLGGEKVESAAVKQLLEDKSIKVERIYGKNRYETAIAIANRFYEKPATVIISNGLVPYDALTGTALATKYDAPLLLTPAGKLNDATRNYINSNQLNLAYILGGEAAVSDSVKHTIEELLN